MLKRLQDLARRYHAARRWLLLLSVATLLGLGLLLLFSASHTQDILMIPLLLFFVWVTMLFSCISLFAHVPAPAPDGAGLLRRTSTTLQRSFFHLFALIMAVVSIGLIVTTYQLVMVWVYMYVL